MDTDLLRGVMAQPTRARIVSRLRAAGRAVGTADLARDLDMHPNGVRLHLDRLAEVGIVERASEQRGRGRPRDVWSISPRFAHGDDPPAAYADLGRWLARSLPAGLEGARMAEEGGVRIGREMADDIVGDTPREKLEEALTSLGFQPVAEGDTQGGYMSFRLGNCPYREAVREHPAVICGLHKGITRGLLEVIAPESSLTRFEVRDPDTAGCRIVVTPDEPEA